MADRIEAVIAVPADDALPIDVQAVMLRRRVILLMQEVAEVDESSVRYRGASDNCALTLGKNTLSVWQQNLIAARFIADGKAKKEIVGPLVREDRDERIYSVVNVVRNEFD
ncbi:hypothetical protein SEA_TIPSYTHETREX_43 [Mycobacterium phage TipsytheTRex]|nr:hypothetical protein SEA_TIPSYTHETREX_43 [Mycobacterium phage TipsytheTRex]